jgi:hypothetical protein
MESNVGKFPPPPLISKNLNKICNKWLKFIFPIDQQSTQLTKIINTQLAIGFNSPSSMPRPSIIDIVNVNLAFLSQFLLNLLDVCDDSPWIPPECLNGGYQNPNNCTECLCPDGYAAPFCHHVAKGNMQGERREII